MTRPAQRPGASRGKPVVAVTGAASGVGAAVATRLAAGGSFRSVVGIDPAGSPSRGGGLTWRRVDVRDPLLAAALRRVDSVVHLALDTEPHRDRAEQRAFNTRGTLVTVTAAAAAGVRRVVIVTSAMVYGAAPDNPVPLPDDAPLSALPEASLLGDLLEIERIAASAPRTYPGLSVTVLRPALLVGPGVPHPAAGLLEGPRLLFVRGARPLWQFVHIDDLASAIELAALGQVAGAAAVGCDGSLEQHDVERITGRHRVELPAAVAFGTAARLHRVGLTAGPASELSYLVYPWVVGCDRLRAAGWRPSYTNEEALQAYVQSRPATAQPGRGVTAGATAAAGATVALVGTAAIVRARRRRQRGR